MGSCPAAPDVDYVGQNPKIYIWGDNFDPDTRVVLAICEMSSIEVDFKLVDTFTKENEKPEFAQISPTKAIPVMLYKNMRVIGASNQQTCLFLQSNFTQVKAKFGKNESQQSKVDSIVRHFLTKVRKQTSILVKSIVNKKVFGKPV